MWSFIEYFTKTENLVTVAVAGLVFLMIVTFLKPLMARNELKDRMERVALERDKLRAQQKAALEEAQNKRLREKPNGLLAELVRALNLHELLEAERYREKLRMAGLRQEKHMVIFLAARVILPVALMIFAYVYMGLLNSEVDTTIRIAGTLAAGVVGFYLPTIILTNMIQRRQQSIRMAWSDALDLMLISVESGMSIEVAMTRVAKEIGTISPALAEELQLTTAELSYLGDRSKALENLAKRTGLPVVKAVVNSLIQAETYGTSLGMALRNSAEENRRERMMELEKKAAALPPKLTVPMVMFFLPVIFIVLLGPASIVAFKLP
ncbi:type II secretion system F family protein [Thermopetrobacter sp. TC1]|uniref:type II secretion system F family protein n=1 Tax=Thermopetrobacter sp. TC1 TaxID=1495045 RepID=UPI00057166D7|nr:type II secretion system F family protein [Thermopetrobacter sp. TC1]